MRPAAFWWATPSSGCRTGQLPRPAPPSAFSARPDWKGWAAGGGCALRTLIATLLALALLAGTTLAAPANPLDVQARSAVLLDARANAVLYAYQPDLRMQPASLAKMMTFLLALEALKAGTIRPDTQVTVSQAAWQLAQQLGPLSDMGLQVGTKVSFQDLLYGLVVSSGNDAAVAIAEALAGSQAAFVAEMNARAAALHLTDTHFANVHGLPAAGQYTTALDMAHLAAYIVLHHPEAAQYTARPSFSWAGITQANWNLPLMQLDPRVFGVKTGHVEGAGYHVAAAARQGDRLLVAVVMGAASDQARAQEADVLLKYGFGQWSTVTLDWRRFAPAHLPVWLGQGGEVPIAPEAPIVLAVSRDQAQAVTARAELRQPVIAPVATGTVLGDLQVLVGGHAVETVPLTAAAAVPRVDILGLLWSDILQLVGRLHL
jgi:D-alanyl-D-alanine carboxypeptidase (penicillin-binding protein 5/6)